MTNVESKNNYSQNYATVNMSIIISKNTQQEDFFKG